MTIPHELKWALIRNCPSLSMPLEKGSEKWMETLYYENQKTWVLLLVWCDI